MTRACSATLRLAVAAVLAVLVALLAPGALPGLSPSARAADKPTTPLRVTLTDVTPGAIPTRGRIEITGIVRNTTEQTWRDVHVYPLTSTNPITTGPDLAEAADSDPTSVIGSRLLDFGRSIGKLAPDATAHFRIRVPVRALAISGQPGVYWLAVHALGTGPEGADEVADGRARTFIPLVGKRVRTIAQVSLVLPVTEPVRRTPDGAVANAEALIRTTSPGGRLARLLDFATASGSTPITWLVDPAVIDAMGHLVDGNAGIDLGRAEDARGGREGTDAPAGTAPPSPGSDTATGAPDADAEGFAQADPETPDDTDQDAAGRWLDEWTDAAKTSNVLALPYGDVDLSSIRAGYRSLANHAWALTDRVLSHRSVSATHAVAPVDGYLRPAATRLLRHHTTVLLGDHDRAHQAIRSHGVRYVYADTSVATGGPSPGNRTSDLQLRQRVLAESALNVLAGRTDPLVVRFPDDWRPGSTRANQRFFAGLDVPWLVASALPRGTKEDRSHKATSVRLDWPRRQGANLLPALNVAASGRLSRFARTVSTLFSDDGLARALRKVALTGVSTHARSAPVDVRVTVDSSERRIRDLLTNIQVEGTDFVVLSGGSGALTVSVHNGLDKAIKVSLRGRADDPKITFDAPQVIELSAGSRATVRLHAHAGAVGVHRVTLTAVTTKGDTVGLPLVFSVRTSQIGRVFWMVLAGGMVVLVLLIARRVRQRIRARRTAS